MWLFGCGSSTRRGTLFDWSSGTACSDDRQSGSSRCVVGVGVCVAVDLWIMGNGFKWRTERLYSSGIDAMSIVDRVWELYYNTVQAINFTYHTDKCPLLWCRRIRQKNSSSFNDTAARKSQQRPPPVRSCEPRTTSGDNGYRGNAWLRTKRLHWRWLDARGSTNQ